jgi:hypothetical protein
MMVFTLEVRNFQFNGVQVPVHIFLIPHAMEIHIPPIPKWSELDSMASKCKIIVIFTRIDAFLSTNSLKSYLTLRMALQTVFPRRTAPLFCCFIEFPSSFRSLYVLDKSSNYWPIARNWKATSAFCVTDLLILDIFLICKI